MQGPSKHGELCDGPGCMPMKPVPEYRWELMKPTGLGHQNWVISSDWMAPWFWSFSDLPRGQEGPDQGSRLRLSFIIRALGPMPSWEIFRVHSFPHLGHSKRMQLPGEQIWGDKCHRSQWLPWTDLVPILGVIGSSDVATTRFGQGYWFGGPLKSSFTTQQLLFLSSEEGTIITAFCKLGNWGPTGLVVTLDSSPGSIP